MGVHRPAPLTPDSPSDSADARRRGAPHTAAAVTLADEWRTDEWRTEEWRTEEWRTKGDIASCTTS